MVRVIFLLRILRWALCLCTGRMARRERLLRQRDLVRARRT
ncbi:hypothetical protein FOPG_16145 [Fusarium oxysporum f. sp. conglutinans race 2 54008]|uniref:Uncharacterized protein n=1 Tax=Fusarium oxysporum f. sp. conglutinans race 2 54008 TaxID=1089457 RepID=X0GWH3_FUSOX|nr:hypothetical protein FOPG_16145 [Fusarium oxysporum f. sp. conglutinans race 2 54008]